MKSLTLKLFGIILASTTFSACGGGGGGSQGGGTPLPPPPPAPVITTIDVAFSAADVVTGSTEAGTATATLSYNVTDGTAEITVALTSITADSVLLRNGIAGAIGDEVYSLEAGTSAGTWTLAETTLNATDIANLDAGAWYLLVTAAGAPALRGQILPAGVTNLRFALSADQVTSGTPPAATGTTWLTIDENHDLISAHLVTTDFTDPVAAGLRVGEAGVDGPIALALSQDAAGVGHWFADAANYTPDMQAAIASGEVYAVLTTTTYPDGAIRGQYLSPGTELVTTDLVPDAVVMSSARFSGSVATGRVATTLRAVSMTSHVNLFNVTGATGVELRQAPVGQNGPMLADYEQDANSPGRWSLTDYPIDALARVGLDNRTLYVSVATTSAPDGAARGQIEAESSSPPSNAGAFTVIASEPVNAAELESLPAMVFITLNREPLPASVTPTAILAEASGGDGSFGDGNEITVAPVSVTPSGNTIEISFAGIAAADDVYRVSVAGGGSNGIVDASGIALDGDGDGSPGGTFETAFEVRQPMMVATLTAIQEDIFTASCATSGCHSGNNPPDGLDLSAGQAYANIVGVASVQMSSLARIAPGDPDNSYLVRKVEGTGIVANRMPLGGAPLSADQIALLRAWVSDGAPNN